MTPLEELQAAHKRLSELREASRCHAVGRWSNEDDEESMMRKEIIGSHGAVGVMYNSEHADLIVTLHRTIDAQLSVLALGVAEQTLLAEQWGEECGEATVYDLENALGLARAINGKAS